MTPTVRKYREKAMLEQDIRKLNQEGIDKDDIYVLAHEKEKTKELAEETDARKIGLKEIGLGSALGTLMKERGEQLRTKLKEIGLSSVEADNYEEDLDKGFLLLIVTGSKDADQILGNVR